MVGDGNGDINKCEAHISARNGGNVAAVKSRVNADVQSNAVSFKDIYVYVFHCRSVKRKI